LFIHVDFLADIFQNDNIIMAFIFRSRAWKTSLQCLAAAHRMCACLNGISPNQLVKLVDSQCSFINTLSNVFICIFSNAAHHYFQIQAAALCINERHSQKRAVEGTHVVPLTKLQTISNVLINTLSFLVKLKKTLHLIFNNHIAEFLIT